MDFAGITDLWNHGLTDLWNYGKDESAHFSLLIAQSLSILSLPSIPFRLLTLVFRQRSVSEAVNKSTRQRVVRQPVGFAGITDLWNYGKDESAHFSLLIAQSLSILSLPSIPFRLLPLVFRQRSVSEASQSLAAKDIFP